MELDDLKQAWQALDRRLERQDALQLQLLQERAIGRARSRLRPLVFGLWCQTLIAGALVFVCASFWVNHRDSLHLMLCGVVLQAYLIMVVVLGARELAMVREIDPAEPVVTNQRRLAELRAWRVRTSPWLGLPWALLWIPMIICLAASNGDDLVARAPEFVILQLVIGAVVLAAILVFIRWSKSRPQLNAALERSASGRSVERARAALDAIARFEQE
ncbi:hypothetical protein [Nannocystis punicea]|uniref:Serine/threonine protein kinase n=1 Tax=Nannocystis punicea TaxID=2995304 RepID=A0ABY7GZY5_9BACT|nr:hypothetical protein [Nannocystis poenicansa]WAS92543.1 hypothetical protein O0S08_40705 [Nannocystis poenicansa]